MPAPLASAERALLPAQVWEEFAMRASLQTRLAYVSIHGRPAICFVERTDETDFSAYSASSIFAGHAVTSTPGVMCTSSRTAREPWNRTRRSRSSAVRRASFSLFSMATTYTGTSRTPREDFFAIEPVTL